MILNWRLIYPLTVEQTIWTCPIMNFKKWGGATKSLRAIRLADMLIHNLGAKEENARSPTDLYVRGT